MTRVCVGVVIGHIYLGYSSVIGADAAVCRQLSLICSHAASYVLCSSIRPLPRWLCVLFK